MIQRMILDELGEMGSAVFAWIEGFDSVDEIKDGVLMSRLCWVIVCCYGMDEYPSCLSEELFALFCG